MLGITGSFVVLGAARAPEVHLLAPDSLRAFYERLALAARRCRDPEQGRANVYAITFGAGAEYAFPCTTECMEFAALQYMGPYQQETRTLCARIALRQPFGPDAMPKDSGEPEGGLKVQSEAPKPRKPRPSGAAVAISQTVNPA